VETKRLTLNVKTKRLTLMTITNGDLAQSVNIWAALGNCLA